jgi:hypothetical protein
MISESSIACTGRDEGSGTIGGGETARHLYLLVCAEDLWREGRSIEPRLLSQEAEIHQRHLLVVVHDVLQHTQMRLHSLELLCHLVLVLSHLVLHLDGHDAVLVQDRHHRIDPLA